MYDEAILVAQADPFDCPSSKLGLLIAKHSLAPILVGSIDQNNIGSFAIEP